jgi:hypothetical protein
MGRSFPGMEIPTLCGFRKSGGSRFWLRPRRKVHVIVVLLGRGMTPVGPGLTTRLKPGWAWQRSHSNPWLGSILMTMTTRSLGISLPTARTTARTTVLLQQKRRRGEYRVRPEGPGIHCPSVKSITHEGGGFSVCRIPVSPPAYCAPATPRQHEDFEPAVTRKPSGEHRVER